jgi:hypothetical protein
VIKQEIGQRFVLWPDAVVSEVDALLCKKAGSESVSGVVTPIYGTSPVLFRNGVAGRV